jgi:hypothetical protein
VSHDHAGLSEGRGANPWDEIKALRYDFSCQQQEITRLSTIVESTVATREWVSREIKPLADSQMRTEQSISKIGDSILAINSTQDEMMRERAQREKEDREIEQHRQREAHEADMRNRQELHDRAMKIAADHAEDMRRQTLPYLLKEKWAPICAALTTIVGFFALLVTYITGALGSWLKAHGF